MGTEQAPSENRKPEPLWIERLDAFLTDEFRFQLNELMITTYWSQVRHGAWSDPINFFEYLDRQVDIVYQLKDSPSLLRSHFALINPSLQPYPQSGLVSKVMADNNLRVLRQQVFLINALHIIIKKRFESDKSLRIPLSIFNELLHSKIIASLITYGKRVKDPQWNHLAHRVERYGTLKDKANEIHVFLSEAIEKSNIKGSADRRDTLLFMREQLPTPFQGNPDNSKVLNAFEENKDLMSLCSALYYEYYLLVALNGLEGLEQKDPTGKTQSQSNDEEREATHKQLLSARQNVMFLLSLMYGTLEVPGEVNKKELSNFVEYLKTIDCSNIYKYVCNPINAKPESTKERQSRIKDIQSVISALKSLKINPGRWKGIEKNIKNLEDEIQSIKYITQEDDEEKRNKW